MAAGTALLPGGEERAPGKIGVPLTCRSRCRPALPMLLADRLRTFWTSLLLSGVPGLTLGFAPGRLPVEGLDLVG